MSEKIKTFKYVRHHEIERYEAQGWVRLRALDGTHHGFYSALMEKIDEQRGTDNTDAGLIPEVPGNSGS
jgi:hypothetical protein